MTLRKDLAIPDSTAPVNVIGHRQHNCFTTKLPTLRKEYMLNVSSRLRLSKDIFERRKCVVHVGSVQQFSTI